PAGVELLLRHLRGDGAAVAAAAKLGRCVDGTDPDAGRGPAAVPAQGDRLAVVLPERKAGCVALNAPLERRLQVEVPRVLRQRLRFERAQPAEHQLAVGENSLTRAAANAGQLDPARGVDPLAHAQPARSAPRLG